MMNKFEQPILPSMCTSSELESRNILTRSSSTDIVVVGTAAVFVAFDKLIFDGEACHCFY